MSWLRLLGLLVAGGTACFAAVDFARDVAPIFRRKCLACHGPSQQLGGVRLDQKSTAMAGGYAGPIIKPGVSKDSRLARIITAGINGKVMPPAGPRLGEGEVATLTTWIDEGANWPETATAVRSESRKSTHWAFQPVVRPSQPTVSNSSWARNPIDAFILQRLEKERIAPSPQADKRMLFRRIYLDLTGLLPSPAQLHEFLSDSRDDAYERAVDTLLASPHFGEKWARHWLDLARYADSDGYEQDGVRPHAWRYRDWVIEAFNRNMPFDRFTVEQLAGDLLPNATVAQYTATGFHRNTLTSREGGIDVEQLRDEQVMDRANTVGSVWMGLTVECARCHDHKYDPISQKEYYQLFAFFNSAEEVNRESPLPGEVGPYLRRLPEYEKKLSELRSRYHVPELQARWENELREAVAHPEARLEWTQVVDYLRVYLDNGVSILQLPVEKRTPKQAHGIMRVFLKSPGPLGSEAGVKELKIGEGFRELEELDAAYPGLSEVPGIQQMARAPKTYIHLRGDFRNPGVEVQPGTLGALPKPVSEGSLDRLALAKWMVSPDNPLTARVAVNRFWQEMFGKGLVSTSDDFGSRGEPPSHPELLDWLASEFVRSGWDVKHLLRLIAVSSTYRQESKVRTELTTIDPANRLLARQSRLRLPAELVRDAALSASGLLHPEIGGKSIRPPLPSGALGVAYRAKWEESTGAERYRRGLYIFLQRSVLYPQLATFDAPNTLTSCSRRERSTTPLQALTLLNDPVFFEAAQALSLRILREGGADLKQRIDYGYQLCLGRNPTGEERERFLRYYDELRTRSENEGAAWVSMGSVLLNLDEFITRE